MRRVILVNRYFAPDHSATSQIATDLARFLAARDLDVQVLTGDRVQGSRIRLPSSDVIDGVLVHRIRTVGRGGSLARRAFGYAQLHRAFYSYAMKLVQPGDVVIAKTDPPLLSVPMAGVVKKRRARLINWLQDLYPEVAASLRVPLVSGPAEAILTRLRDRSLKAANANVAISDGMAARLRARGIPDGTIKVIHNWADDEGIGATPADGNGLRATWGLSGKFVVGYSGNLGRAHEIDTILAAARRLQGRDNLVFLFIGGGHLLEALKARAAGDGTSTMFAFQPHQPRAGLGLSLTAPDVHLVSLRPEVEGLIFPSKLYGVAAAGRPVIAIVDPAGDVASVVNRHACGLVVRPGDGEGLAAAVVQLQADPKLRETMGLRGRAMIDRSYSKGASLNAWAALIDEIASR